MLTATRHGYWTAFLAATVVASAAAGEPSHGVRDNAKVFRHPEVAHRSLVELHRRTGKDVLIETRAGLSDEEKTAFAALKGDAAQERAFLRDLALKRAREAGVDGIYALLLSKKPLSFRERASALVRREKNPQGHVVVVYPEENARIFPQDDVDEFNSLLGAIRNGLRNHDADLMASVRYAERALEANLRAQAAAPVRDGFHWSDAVAAAGLLVATWLVVLALRGRDGTETAAGSDVAAVADFSGAAAGYWLWQAVAAWSRQRPCAPATELPSTAQVPALTPSESF